MIVLSKCEVFSLQLPEDSVKDVGDLVWIIEAEDVSNLSEYYTDREAELESYDKLGFG